MPASRIRALVDLSRARQALLSVAQPALGAVLAAEGLPAGRVIALGLVAASCGYLAVFSLNDVLDRHADRRALETDGSQPEGPDIDIAFVRHPLAHGHLSAAVSWAWVLALAAVAVVAAWMLNPVCVALFACSVALEAVYCALRNVTPLKTLISGVMVALGGLAGWVAVAPVSWRAVSFFGFLTLWEIAGRNLPNDLADVRLDSRVGIRTVATVWGPRASAIAIAWGTAATLAFVAALPAGLLGRVLSVGLTVWTMGLPALGLLQVPSSERAGRFFNRASLLPALVFAVALVTATGP